MNNRHKQHDHRCLGGRSGGGLKPIGEVIAKVVQKQNGGRRLNVAPLLAIGGLLALALLSHV